MAINHQWVTEELLHTRYIGQVTGKELLQAAYDIGGDPRMDKIRYVIGDWSQVKDAQVSADDVRELAAYIIALSKSYPLVKNASVVANYESGEARATLYDVLTADAAWETATFATYEEAIDWFDSFKRGRAK